MTRHPTRFRPLPVPAWIGLCILAVGVPTALHAGAVRKAPVPPPYVWWEAEKPAATNFPPPNRHSFAPANPEEASVLSEGRWIGADDGRNETLFLEYEIDIPRAGDYRLYARKFWKHGPYRWRFDGGAWHSVGGDVALLDNAPLRQFVGANWTPAGSVTLEKGRRRLRIELASRSGAAAFDAFVLTSAPFHARGKLKPGEKYNRAPPGWFPFEPDPDPFRASAIDLRSLNEPVAGQNGFIRVKNGSFVHGKTGKPIRFWAVNAGGDIARMDPPSIDTLARTLAKKGVNLIRLHGAIYEGSGPDFGNPDLAMMDRIRYLVAAMKRQGIYTCLSIYFPLWVRLDEADGWPGYHGENPFDMIYFHPEFQRIYRSWWRALLTGPNPHGGPPVGRDPAVAMLEMVNEESHFFWTFTPYQNLPEPQTILLEKRFGGWLARKYGSVESARKEWEGNPIRGDVPAEGRAGFMPLWDIFNKRDRRASDTAAFLADDQLMFYRETYQYLKKDLGFQGSIYASNWKTASPTYLEPLDKFTNSVSADFLDRHGYFGGPHEGERAGYSLSEGDRYRDRSLLRFEPGGKDAAGLDYDSPLIDVTYDGKPSTITEINWNMPNRYRADLTILSATYGLLQGSDAFFFFALTGPSWQDLLSKWPVMTPVTMGQFPAAAFVYRKGLLRTPAPVVEVDLNIDDLRALKGAPVSGTVSFDELRAADIPAGRTASVPGIDRIDPRAFAVGPVSVRFTNGKTELRTADLSRSIDETSKTIRSVTGQLAWNYGTGRVTIDAPAVQGVTGFLKAGGPIGAKDATFAAAMEYGSVLLVALDGLPISKSSRMLLQVMSEESNHGWRTRDEDGMKVIDSLGVPPIVVRDFGGTVRLRRPDAAKLKVTALDFNGYPIGRPRAGGASIPLRRNVLYYLIEK